jgi:hypothetical protein
VVDTDVLRRPRPRDGRPGGDLDDLECVRDALARYDELMALEPYPEQFD